MTLREGGLLIGLVTLIRRKGGIGEIGRAIHSDHRNRGPATEGATALAGHAFAVLGLRSLCAETQAGNLASLRVIEKLGMHPAEPGKGRREGDASVFTITAEQWSANRGATTPPDSGLTPPE